jgi:hypothetical protein
MKIVILTERDISLLHFLWRWKLLSTAALTEAFFHDRSPITAYVRLWHLREGNYIQIVSESGGKAHYWSLAQKGFAAIQSLLPELAEAGFKSEYLRHDHLVTALHLGNWLLYRPKSADIFTEQELRRYHLDHYPEWLPRTTEHRPDGYWRIHRNGKWITIGLEVEVSLKRDRFYRQVAHFYDRHPDVYRVLWLTPTRGSASAIQKLLQSEVGPHSTIHDFITLKDFEDMGWHSPIMLGAEEGKPLCFLLDPSLQTQSIPVWTRFLIDTRKCPHRSKTYQNLKSTTSLDRGVPAQKADKEQYE